LPDSAVKESRERVHAAIKNAGLSYPRKRLIVHLALASARKKIPVDEPAHNKLPW
jgi:magnesium chelatase family protein